MSKKQISIGKILGIVAMVVAIASIFMGLLNSFKGESIEEYSLWHWIFKHSDEDIKYKSIIAVFSILLIGILTLISAVITNFVKKDKISGVIYLVGSILMFVSAILALLILQLLTIEIGEEISGVKLSFAPILIGVLGITSSGLGIASGVLNLKK